MALKNKIITRSNKVLTKGNKIVTGCGVNFRQARYCEDDSLIDVWMTGTDASLLAGMGFFVPWLAACCYFNYTDPIYSAIGGTIYTYAEVTAYVDCPTCLPCFAPAVPSPLPATITFTLPTSVTFASCTTPEAVAGPYLTSVVTTHTGGRWNSPATSSGVKIAGWLTRSAIVTGSAIYAAMSEQILSGGCHVWEFAVLYQEQFFPFDYRAAVWRRRRVSSAVLDLYGSYYFAGISSSLFPCAPTLCPGATATPFLYASP